MRKEMNYRIQSIILPIWMCNKKKNRVGLWLWGLPQLSLAEAVLPSFCYNTSNHFLLFFSFLDLLLLYKIPKHASPFIAESNKETASALLAITQIDLITQKRQVSINIRCIALGFLSNRPFKLNRTNPTKEESYLRRWAAITIAKKKNHQKRSRFFNEISIYSSITDIIKFH